MQKKQHISHPQVSIKVCIQRINLFVLTAARLTTFQSVELIFASWCNMWINGHTSTMPNNKYGKYHAAFAASRDDVVREFTRCYEYLPNTFLKKNIFKLAASPEAFLFLRKDYTYSLACVSIFGYILGIGDRHLQNFLLDLKSGRIIPIDFGYAFGTATELLPVPELVPFRLTRQLVGVLEPLGVSGILEEAMTNILSAIQDRKESLLNIMSVFSKEPLLEWRKKSHRQQDLAQNKMEVARRKLGRENPAAILVSELTNGHGSKDFYEDIVSIARGTTGHDIRAEVGDVCSDANEQVKCLINLATDLRVLGIAWAGWQPYL